MLLNPKLSLVDRSVLEFTDDKLVPPDIYVDRATLRSPAAYEHVDQLVHGDSNSDLEMLAERHARIRELEREAESLQEKCIKYQQRAARSNISRRRPATPSSRADSPLLTLVSDLSHPYTAQLSKSFTRPLSPEKARTPSPAAYDAGNAFPAAHHRVTFYQDQLHKSYGMSSLSSAEAQSPRHDDLPKEQHSFTHLSFRTRRKLQRDADEGTERYPVNQVMFNVIQNVLEILQWRIFSSAF